MSKNRRGSGPADGKAWSGRFREPTHRLVEAFTGSVMVDRRLYAQDIQGSIAHCKTLEKARVLTQTESRTILRVDLDDAVEADRIFTILMGDEVELRRQFIETHADTVMDLDV